MKICDNIRLFPRSSHHVLSYLIWDHFHVVIVFLCQMSCNITMITMSIEQAI